MATIRWTGNALAVAQIDLLTVSGTIEASDLFLLTINGKTITIEAGSTAAADVAEAIAQAWNSSTIPEFAEISATAVTNQIRLTANEPGRPFELTATTTEAGGDPADDQTFSHTTLVASAGPHHWNSPSNWSSGSVPTSGDDVFLQQSDSLILYGLDQSAVTLASLHLMASFTGQLGLPQQARLYREYRQRELAIGATFVEIGAGSGGGSGLLRLNNLTVATTLNILRTAMASEPNLPALTWRGTHADNELTLMQGSAGVALEAAQSATICKLRIGQRADIGGEATLVCGVGVALDEIEQSGGELTTASHIGAIRRSAGIHWLLAGNVTSLDDDGGTTHYLAPGTLASARLGRGAHLDFSGDMRAKSVTNCALHAGSRLTDSFRSVTFTGGIDLVRCSLADVALDLGTHVNLQPSSVS